MKPRSSTGDWWMLKRGLAKPSFAASRPFLGFGLTMLAVLLLACVCQSHAQIWTNLVNGDASGSWNVPRNWSGGIPDAVDAVADFSTLNLQFNSTVTNATAHTVGSLKFDDTASGNTWTLVASNLTLATSTGSPSINVISSNLTTTLALGLAGNQGFIKSGAGTLMLSGGTNNTIGGPILITNGVLSTANGASLKNITGTITVAAGAVLNVNGNFDNTISPSPIVLNGKGNGTLGALHANHNQIFSGPITISTDSRITHDWNRLTFNGNFSAPSGSNNLELVITLSGQQGITVNGNVNLGSGFLNVTSVPSAAAATVTVTLAGTNTWGGLNIQSNATVLFNSPNALGSGAITLCDGATAALKGTNLIPLLLQIPATNSGVIAFNATNSSVTLDFGNYANLSLGSLGTSTYSGVLVPNGNTYRLGGGGGRLVAASGLTNPAAGLIVDGQNSNSMVVLTGPHTYGGATLVNNGTLVATGVFSGPVTVSSNGVLSPGPLTGLGSLIVSNVADLRGTTLFAINRSDPQGADLLVANSLTLDGTLSVTNIGPPLVLGDTFQLFSVAGLFSNAQPSLNLPALAGGLRWDVSQLVPNGLIRVAQLTNTVGDANWPSLLSQDILWAYNSGYSNVTINPGTYVMPNGSNVAFTLSRLQNFTINASNALFTVGPGRCFELDNCTNVTLAGATVRAQIFPFTQGRVVEIGTNNGVLYCDWRISDGYATTGIRFGFNAINASNQLINLPTGDLYYDNHYGSNAAGIVSNAVYLGDQTWRLNFPGWLTSFYFQTNDWLVSRAGLQGFAYYLNACSNCTLLNVTSESGGFATFREITGGGNHMLGCQIRPAPVPPPGGTELPVVACSADGFHASATYPGMHLENCVYQGVLLDDNIAIHGNFEYVLAASGNTVTFDGPGMFAVGDPVRISSTNGAYFAQAICTGIQNLGNGQYQVTLDQPLSIPPGTGGTNPKYNGSGYKIINCRLGNVRSRAIVCKADNGLISGNVIQDARFAIQLGPESYWGEGDYVWNTVITNNLIRHCGSAGVTLVTDGAVGNQNLTIQNNYFEDVLLGDSISLNGCNGVVVDGNIFANPAASNNPIWLANSTNIVLLKNFVTNNAANVSFVGLGTKVGGVQNQQNGILLAGVPYAVANSASNLFLNLPSGGGVGTQVIQQALSRTDNEHWLLSPVGNGYCAVVCAANGLALGVNGSTASDAPVVMENYAGADSQLWALSPLTNNTLAFTNKLSGLALHSASSTPGQGLVQRPFSGLTNQQWNFVLVPTGNPYWWDADGNLANGITDGSGIWDATNSLWFRSGLLPEAPWPGPSAIAAFGASGTGTVTINGTQDLAGLIFNTVYTLTGGVLNGSTNSSLLVSNSANATVASSITGSQTLTKVGSGTLTLNSANTYSGGTILSGGILTAGNATALGPGVITLNSGANRLVIADGLTLTNSLVISGGSSASNRGLIENSGNGTAILSGGRITINGSAGAGGHFASVSASSGGTLAIYDPITATVPVLWRLGNGILAGGGSYSSFVQQAGTVKLGADNGLSTSAVCTLGGSGGTTFLDLAGYQQTLAGVTQAASYPAVITNSSTTSDSLLTITGDCTYGGLLADRVKKLSLLITGGTVTLTNANPLTGLTTVSNGTLRGTGSLAGPLTIQAGGVLQPGPGLGAFTVRNLVTNYGTIWLEVNRTNQPIADQLAANAMTFGGTLIVSNIGPPLAEGDTFTVFSGPASGAFSITNLPPLSSNLVWDATGLNSSGLLKVTTNRVVRPPGFTSIVLTSPTNLLLTATGSPPGTAFIILSQTNVTLPRTNWQPIATNIFAADGPSTNLLAIPPTPRRQFFRLQTP